MSCKICVFCGSSPFARPDYFGEATILGHLLAEKQIGLVFGGGGTGLMGALARAARQNSGHITGVVPQSLIGKEILFDEYDLLHITNSYHERKMLMYHLSDGFFVLPGGPGTLEELMEHLTWMHRGRICKPVYVVNHLGYWDPLLQMFEKMRETGFIATFLSDRFSTFNSAHDAVSDFIETWR